MSDQEDLNFRVLNPNSETKEDFKNCIPNFKADAPLIKGTKDDLVYIDAKSNTVILIHKGEQINPEVTNRFLSGATANRVLFEVKKYSYNTIKLCLHYFVENKEPFKSIEVSIKEFEM